MNVFVIGFEPFNLDLLRSTDTTEPYSFISLLSYDQAVRPRSGRFNLQELLVAAERRLGEFSNPRRGSDCVIGYWDFPSTVLAPVLCHRHALPGPSLHAVAKCEHKYWSRIEQSRVVPDILPQFCAVDPFDDDAPASIDLPYPYWIKPVKAHSSFLGFRIHNEQELREHLPDIRAKIGIFGDPLNEFLAMVDVPASIARIDGNHCIAEAIIAADHQCTLEGYVCEGEVVVYGVVDSIRGGELQSSFERYQYPSQIPPEVQQRMIEAARRVMTQIGYDNAPFNMEFFWDQQEDSIRLLEVNPRISKSHAPLFLMVDGATHQKVTIDLALARRPEFPFRQGHCRVAAKFMVRMYDAAGQDGTVTRMPHAEEINRVCRSFPDVRIRLMAEEGMPLSALHFQDSYSHELAEIFLGADSEEELLTMHDECRHMLPFAIEAHAETV